MKKRILIRTTIFALVIGLVALVSAYVYHFRPLVQATPWKVHVEHNKLGATDAKVYGMLFSPHRLFIELPESHRYYYRWFAIDTDRRAIGVPNGPRTEPYLHQNHDMNLGVGLTDPKLGDTWSVAWKESGVTFKNRDFEINLSH